MWGALKKKRAGGILKEINRSLECTNRWQYRCLCNKEWFRQERGSSLPAATGSQVQVTWLKPSRIIQVGGSRSPSIQSRPLSLRLRHFWSPRKGFEGQTIHLGRWCQAVRAELVHNAAPGILRDSHSPPCVAVGQVPQQPWPILLTYRYWFLFLGFRLVSFLLPLINNKDHNT